MRRVLFIAYNFPPHGGAGVQRSVKFVKYLPEFGWRPLVLTTTADASPVQDSTLLNDVSADVPIRRVPGFSITRLQARLARHRMDRLAVALNLLLQIPDPTRFWARNTHAAISQIVQREKPHVIYTTSGPYSNHLVGLWARRRFHLPWLADFRDPWSQNLLMPYLPGYRAINRRMERQVLAEADCVACVSQPWLSDLQKNLGRQAEKFIVLPNGYDETDVQPLPPPTPTERFTLTHLGSFYHNRRPDALIQAIQLLIQTGRIPQSEIRVVFVGKNARQHVPDTPPFETHDYVPHKELDRFRNETSAFLLVLATSPDNVGNYSGKLFEYLALNRPILGVAPPGGVAEQLIHATRTGITANGDVSAIADAVEDLFRQYKSGAADWNPDWTIIRQYTRRNLTARLAAEFNRLADSEAAV